MSLCDHHKDKNKDPGRKNTSSQEILHTLEFKCPTLYFNARVNNRLNNFKNEEIFWKVYQEGKTEVTEAKEVKEVNKETKVTKVTNKKDALDNDKQYLALLHCYNLEEFENIYGKYVQLLFNKNFRIIVSFSLFGKSTSEFTSESTSESTLKFPCVLRCRFPFITFLRVSNRGHDVGAKLSLLDYVFFHMIPFKLVLFLHSKTNKLARDEYFNSLLRNETILQNNIEKIMTERVDILLNCVRFKNLHEKYASNRTYHEELLLIYGAHVKEHFQRFPFSEGNCNFMSQQFVQRLYKDNGMHKILYNLLNDENSFDLNWYRTVYSFDQCSQNSGRVGNNKSSNKNSWNNQSNWEFYQHFLTCQKDNVSRIAGNDFSNSERKLPDAMVEHAIERIYINLCVLKKLKFRFV